MMSYIYSSGFEVPKNTQLPDAIIYYNSTSLRKPRFSSVAVKILNKARYFIALAIAIGLIVSPLFTGMAASPYTNNYDATDVANPVADTNGSSPVSTETVKSAPIKPISTNMAPLKPISKVSAPVVAAPVNTDAEVYYIQAVNTLRASKQLKSLSIDKRLSKSAANKTQDMITMGYWGHYAPNSGPSFSDFIWRDSPNADQVGENLAKCYTTRAAAFDALVKSPTHFAIMVGNFEKFGVYEATEPKSGCIYTTMHFSHYK